MYSDLLYRESYTTRPERKRSQKNDMECNKKYYQANYKALTIEF